MYINFYAFYQVFENLVLPFQIQIPLRTIVPKSNVNLRSFSKNKTIQKSYKIQKLITINSSSFLHRLSLLFAVFSDSFRKNSIILSIQLCTSATFSKFYKIFYFCHFLIIAQRLSIGWRFWVYAGRFKTFHSFSWKKKGFFSLVNWGIVKLKNLLQFLAKSFNYLGIGNFMLFGHLMSVLLSPEPIAPQNKKDWQKNF